MAAFHQHTFTPQQLAQSIDAHFTGNKPIECVEQATAYLTKFGYYAVPMSRFKFQPPQQSPQHHPQQRLDKCHLSGTKYLYCGNCTTHSQPTYNDNNHTFQCCVVAGFHIQQEVSGQYTLRFTELYPHARECTETKRSNHIRSRIRQGAPNFGPGFYTFDINFDDVFGDDVLVRIINQIGGLSKDELGQESSKHGEGYFLSLLSSLSAICTYTTYVLTRSIMFIFVSSGKKITSGYTNGETPELRWYVLLDCNIQDAMQQEINQNYGLHTLEFQESLKKLYARLSIVLANELNIAHELNFEKPEFSHNVIPPNSTMSLHHHLTNITQRHLSLQNPSIIFGGYNGQNTQEIIHQIPHTDYAPVGGVDLTDSDNFQTNFKPASLFLPLVDTRKIIFYKDVNGNIMEHEVVVHKGQMLVFEGDVVHGGASYNDDHQSQHLQLYPALHLYLYSTEHPSNMDTFTISPHHCLMLQQFHPFLKHVHPTLLGHELQTSTSTTAIAINAVKDCKRLPDHQMTSIIEKFDSDINDTKVETKRSQLSGTDKKGLRAIIKNNGFNVPTHHSKSSLIELILDCHLKINT